MQLGRARLTPEECQKQQREGRCFYCGDPGHLVSSCPAKKTPAVSSNQVSKTNFHTLTQVTLNSLHVMEVMIDSGADESLMDWGLANKSQIDSDPLARPIRAHSLNGKEIFAITHISRPVKMTIGDHHEMIQFHLFTSLSHSLILGQPWLYEHNPHINWKNGQIREWEEECKEQGHMERFAEINLFSANPVSDSDYPDQTTVPPCYHHLKEVFSKSLQSSVSPSTSPLRLCHRLNSGIHRS